MPILMMSAILQISRWEETAWKTENLLGGLHPESQVNTPRNLTGTPELSGGRSEPLEVTFGVAGPTT